MWLSLRDFNTLGSGWGSPSLWLMWAGNDPPETEWRVQGTSIRWGMGEFGSNDRIRESQARISPKGLGRNAHPKLVRD